MLIEEHCEQWIVNQITDLGVSGVRKVSRTGATEITPAGVVDLAKVLPYVGVGLYNEDIESDLSAAGTVQRASYTVGVFIVTSSRYDKHNARDIANAIHRSIKYALRGAIYEAEDGTRGVLRYQGRQYIVDEEFPQLLVVQQTYQLQYQDSNE